MKPLGNATKKEIQFLITKMNWSFGKGDVQRLVWTSPTSGFAVVRPYLCDTQRYLFKCEVKGDKTYVTYRSHKRLVRTQVVFPF